MLISLFAAVLLIQTLLFIINAIGAKAINEVVQKDVIQRKFQFTDMATVMAILCPTTAEIQQRCARPTSPAK